MSLENEVPQTQKAWVAVNRGRPREAVILKERHPVPLPLDKDDVLIKVHAAGFNPVGWKLMRYVPNYIANRPVIAENDLSGTIVQSNVAEFKPGEAVFGWTPVGLSHKTHLGSLCEYVRLASTYVVHKPNNIDFIQAAGVSLAGLTAYQGLELAQLEPDQRILINGGTTAVGIFAIQLAKARGCMVTATCSTPSIGIVKDLGADEVIDYKSTSVIEHLKQNASSSKFHAIFDTVGASADLFTSSPSYLTSNGIFVSVGISTGGVRNIIFGTIKSYWPSWLGGTKRTFKSLLTYNDKSQLESLRNLIEQGKVKPLVDSTFSFDEVYDAYDRLMTGRAKGKVIVRVI